MALLIGKKVNFTFTPSLEQMTLANIAITLWNQDDVRDLMSKFALHILHKNWQGIEKAVIEKSFTLRLPRTLNEKLLGFIGRVGLQIISWVDFHHCNYSIITELPATFVWTSLGTINNIKTAKLLIMGSTLDDDKSFALACVYCFENEIKYYWNIFKFSRDRFNFGSIGCVSYWINYMQELHKKESLITYSPSLMIPDTSFVFEAVKNGNEAATRYYFNLNNMKIEDSVIHVAGSVAFKMHDLEITSLQRYSDVMLFLLSAMNAEQQTKTILHYTYECLKCLLVWPWHNFFLEISKGKFDPFSLCKLEYGNLLCSMVDMMYYECNVRKLFEGFWQQTPGKYKVFFAIQGNIVHVLIGLYKAGDENNVKLILKDLSISTKENIFQYGSKPIFIYLVSSKKWDSIEFLIQECLSSRDDLIRFRDVFKNVLQQLSSKTEFCKGGYSEFEFIEECQWDKFFQLVDSCISRYNNKKRCI